MRNLLVLVSTLALVLLLAFQLKGSSARRLSEGWSYALWTPGENPATFSESRWSPITHAASFAAGHKGQSLAYRVTLPPHSRDDERLLFLQWVQDAFAVQLGETRLFQTEDFERSEVHRTLRNWWLVSLGHQVPESRLYLLVRPSSQSVPSVSGMPLLGARHELIQDIFLEEIYKIAVSSLSIFFGVVILIFYFSSEHRERSWLTFAVMSIFFGVWVISSAATRMRLFLLDDQSVWLHLDHLSLYTFGMLLMRSYANMVSPGPWRICEYYGRLTLWSLPLVLSAELLGFLNILDVLPVAQGLLSVGAGIILFDGAWMRWRKGRVDTPLTTAGMVSFALCGIHDMLMDVGVIPWGPQLTPFAGLVLVLSFAAIIANQYWNMHENLEVAQVEADRQRLNALQLETAQRLSDAEHEAEIRRSRDDSRQKLLLAMLSLADRFNSPVTAILNHTEHLMRRFHRLKEQSPEQVAALPELRQLESGLGHLKASADELRSLSMELSEYRESSESVRAQDLDLKKLLHPS